MAITAKPYLAYLMSLSSGTHNMQTDTLHFALLSSAYAPQILSDSTFAQISGNEVTGAGYTAGGDPVTGVSLDVTPALGIKVVATALTWTGLSATFRYAVLYNTSKSGSLIGLVDFGENQVYTAADFTMTFSTGLLTFEQAGS